MDSFSRIYTLMSSQGCGVLPVSEIQAEKTLLELGFDSLRYMELVLLIEEEFGISLPDHALDVTSDTTVASVTQSVMSCLNQ